MLVAWSPLKKIVWLSSQMEIRVERPTKPSVECTINQCHGNAPPLSQHTEQYLPHNDHSVSNISKHMYNCEGHHNSIGSIMLLSFHQPRKLSWQPFNMDTFKGAPASHMIVPNNILHTMIWPLSKVT